MTIHQRASRLADAVQPAASRPMPAVPGVEHRQVETRRLRVHMAEAGTGPPLLLLHGWPQHWYAWRKLIPLLAGSRRLICPDLRGFGWTDAPDEGYRTADLAADAVALLDALELIDAAEDTAPAVLLADLVRAAQAGDTMAMAELLDVLTPYVSRRCGPIALDDGADAAQEALIKVLTGIGQLREPAALFGWARAITIREAVRTASKARRAIPAELADVPAPGDPQLASDVRDVLRRLAPHDRAILVLRDLEGLDERTVSDMLAVSTGTAKSRLHRARRRFRQEWDR